MTAIDFAIGALLMNAMPHLVLGIWKGRMFSAFGFGNRQNIAYACICLVAALVLFIYQYGISGLSENGIFTGALSLLLIYFATGYFWYRLFKKNEKE